MIYSAIVTILAALWLLLLGILIGLKIEGKTTDKALDLCEKTNECWCKYCECLLSNFKEICEERVGEENEKI